MEVRAAEADELRVGIREETTLQQRIVREVDAGHDVAGMEGDLFGFRKEVIGIAVEHHAPDRLQGHHFFRNQLGRVEDVEWELSAVFWSNACTESSNSGKSPDAMASKRSRRCESGSAPYSFTDSSQMSDAAPIFGRQWNLTKVDLPSASTNRKVCTPKPSIMRNERGSVRSDIAHRSMCMLSGINVAKSQKVSCAEAACGNPRSGSIFTEWMRSGNLIGVLDEEDRDVVAHQVEVALGRVELHGKAADIARRVAGTGAAGNRRKTHKYRRFDLWILQKCRPRQLRHRLIRLEKPMRSGAACVDDALGNTLVIEVGDFLAEDEVFEKRGASAARAQRVLIVGNRRSLVRRQSGSVGRGTLVKLSSLS